MCTYIRDVCVWCLCVLCVHVPSVNADSALLMAGPGGMEMRQTFLRCASISSIVRGFSNPLTS